MLHDLGEWLWELLEDLMRWLTGECRAGAHWFWNRTPEPVRRFITETLGIRG